ncbi:MAG: cholesterol esterase [Candelina mexicana]|nr:MAG: cholesterol esterase [Candelina mexicana]
MSLYVQLFSAIIAVYFKYLSEYLALLGSFVLIGLEVFIRVITLALPQPIIRFCYNRSRNVFNALSSPTGRRARLREKTIVSSIANASDFVDLCALFGYYAEEHIVQTGDGYLLGLHRLGWKRGEEGSRVNSGEGSTRKRVVYLHHGLLMNSEVWVCLTEEQRCLPFMLVERAYDVWLGNNRGNKYSKKSTRSSPTSMRFWDFSMDQFAFHDIPDSIDYILSTTSQASLSYIGFSQGTAQAFATLSIHPTLNDKVDVFIALAPAMSPAGLSNGVVDSLIKVSPEVIFLAFGRRSILSSATMWQAILYPPIFVRIIDTSLSFLFGWTAQNINNQQKLAAYPHLYSYTSTKSVVHWFQIIRNKSFQMYDDEVQAPLSIGAGAKYYKVAKFPTRNIKTPIVLLYGGSDSLVDIGVMLRELPRHTVAKEVPHFEHLDFLWGNDVDTLVFPYVFDALNSYADPTRQKSHFSPFKLAGSSPLSIAQPPSYSEDERLDTAADADAEDSPRGSTFAASKHIKTPSADASGIVAPSSSSPTTSPQQATSPPQSSTARNTHARRWDFSSSSSSSMGSDPANHAMSLTTQATSPTTASKSPAGLAPISHPHPHQSSSEPPPEAATKLPITPFRKTERSGSMQSDRSTDSNTSSSPKFEPGGISLGPAKAAGGVVSKGAVQGLKEESGVGKGKRGRRK